jgi:hypothetical protein
MWQGQQHANIAHSVRTDGDEPDADGSGANADTNTNTDANADTKPIEHGEWNGVQPDS